VENKTDVLTVHVEEEKKDIPKAKVNVLTVKPLATVTEENSSSSSFDSFKTSSSSSSDSSEDNDFTRPLYFTEQPPCPPELMEEAKIGSDRETPGNCKAIDDLNKSSSKKSSDNSH